MRKENICISERNLVFAIAGQLFDQAPNRQPRKAEIIMNKVSNAFRKDAHNSNEYYTLVIDQDKFDKYIHDLLFAIPEFQELNLSQIEFEKNISVDDESRPKYSFTSAYDVETSDSWKRDFIDLDAFTRNVINKIYIQLENDKDCGCCTYEQSSRECLVCSLNQKFGIKYQGRRNPRGKYTFACKYDCFKGRYICCEECDEKDTCIKKCDQDSKKCILAINRKVEI